MTDDPVDLSGQFLRAIRKQEPTAEVEETLAGYDSEALAAQLDSDGKRLAFWINLYNGGTQQLLERHRDRYENRRAFFSTPAVTVAGRELSLDDIEHRILRRSYSKYSFGYIRNPFRGSFARTHELSERDARVHFALNCGATSCPPIAAYTAADIDQQLDWATEGYLAQSVEYDTENNTVEVPRLMRWFRGDFGGKRGILDMLREYDQLPEDVSPRLSYDDWKWSLAPGKFIEKDGVEGPDAFRE